MSSRAPVALAPLVLFAGVALVAIGAAACSSDPSDEAAGSNSTDNGGSYGDGTGSGAGRSSPDGGPGGDADGDPGAGKDGSAKDAGHDGSVDAGLFGTSVGDDPCVTGAGRAPAWTTRGRCSSRPGRSAIVSSQTGAIAHSNTITSQGDVSLGEPTFASDGTAYVSNSVLTAFAPKTFVPSYVSGGYLKAPVLGPDGTLYVSAGSPFHDLSALDPASGVVKWTRSDLNGSIPRPTILADGTIALLLRVPSTKILVLDPATGADLWSVALPDNGSTGSLVASVDGTIYATDGDAGIFAVSSSTHGVLWNVPVAVRDFALDERAQRLYFVAEGGYQKLKVGWMATSGGAPVFGTPFTMVSAFGNLLHTTELSDLALGENGWVYFSAERKFFGCSTMTDTVWQASTATDSYTPARPVVGGDGTVYLAAYKADGGYAMAFTKTGTLLWNKRLSSWALDKGTYHLTGTALSIAPTGHLVVTFDQDHSVHWLGP